MTASSSRTTVGRMSRSSSSGTTTETKMSRLIRPSGLSWRGLCWSMIFSENRPPLFGIMLARDVVVPQWQRLIEIVDVVDLAAQNGNDVRRRRIALEQDRPAVVDPGLRQDRLDLPQRSHVAQLPQDGHVARRVPAHSIEAGGQRERRQMGRIATGRGVIGPLVVRRVAHMAQGRKPKRGKRHERE